MASPAQTRSLPFSVCDAKHIGSRLLGSDLLSLTYERLSVSSCERDKPENR
jgi:hypothetical protein